MLHLLTETHLFVSLPNDCLCQITGEPVIHMTPVASHGSGQASTVPLEGGNVRTKKRPLPLPDAHQDECQSKRLKTASSGLTHRQHTSAAVSRYVSLDLSLVFFAY
jgi:hypothetical protein